MAGETRVTGQAYYDAMPGSDLAVGDIWNEMPTFGHWRRTKTTRGIVITPACDLSNRKAETITYLPVISFPEYLTSRSFAVELVRLIKSQEEITGLVHSSGWTARAAILPTLDSVRRVHDGATSLIASRASDKVKAAASRCIAAAKALIACREGRPAELENVKHALGAKEFGRIGSAIVTNSYASDIHFLPSDGRVGVYSAMPTHSIALFRYPLSLPVEILQAANDISLTNWRSSMLDLCAEYPIAQIVEARPIKIGALRNPYLADLISRFAGLHIRMGSPDFTKETVSRYVQDIEGTS